ncbi:hypothetical protein JHK87_005901 [Glycine soja]|nr:hypothetical protein JHK87_005901 [Glycine soja]
MCSQKLLLHLDCCIIGKFLKKSNQANLLELLGIRKRQVAYEVTKAVSNKLVLWHSPNNNFQDMHFILQVNVLSH